MIQNGRKSAFSRTVVKPEKTRISLVPPAYLNEEERTFLVDLFASADPEQFIPTDMPVLATYAEVVIAARKAKAAGDLDRWDKLAKMQCRVGSRLRLVPSARSGRKKAARIATKIMTKAATPVSPWD